MPNTFTSPIAKTNLPNQNILDRVSALEQRAARLFSADPQVQSLDQVAPDGGVQQTFEWIAGNGTFEGGDLTGVQIGYPGYTVNGVIFSIVGMNNGVLEFGISAIDGTALFAGGAGIINSQGIYINGLNYLIDFDATNAGNTRYASIGMFLPNVGATTIPAFGDTYYAAPGTDLVPDDTYGNFTDSQSVWTTAAVSPYTIYGNNSFYHAPTLGFPGNLSRTITGLSGNTLYTASFAEKLTQGAFVPYMTIQEKNSGGTNVGMLVTINGAVNSSWVQFSQSWKTQSTTTQVLITIYPGWNFNAVYFDAIYFGTQSVSWSHWKTDAGEFETAPQIGQNQTTTPSAPPSGYLEEFSDSNNVLYTQDNNGNIFPTNTYLNRTVMQPLITECFWNNFSPYTVDSNAAQVAAVLGGHPGVVELGTANGQTYGGLLILGLTTGAKNLVLTGGEVFDSVFQIQNASSAMEEQIGFFDTFTPTVATANGAYIDVANLTLKGINIAASSSASTGTTYTVTGNTWYRGKVVVNSNATQIDFYLYDNTGTNQLWHDSLSTKIPTLAVAIGQKVMRNTSTVTYGLYVDWCAFYNNTLLTR